MDCSRPGPSVCGILQARILGWVAIPFSRGSSQFRDRTWLPALQADSLPSEPPGKPLFFVQSDPFSALRNKPEDQSPLNLGPYNRGWGGRFRRRIRVYPRHALPCPQVNAPSSGWQPFAPRAPPLPSPLLGGYCTCPTRSARQPASAQASSCPKAASAGPCRCSGRSFRPPLPHG